MKRQGCIWIAVFDEGDNSHILLSFPDHRVRLNKRLSQLIELFYMTLLRCKDAQTKPMFTLVCMILGIGWIQWSMLIVPVKT